MAGETLERVLRLLKDERWHSIDDITDATRIPEAKMQIITEFLAKYGFIQIDRNNRRIRMAKTVAEFFRASSSQGVNKGVKPIGVRSKYSKLEEKTAL